MAKIKLAVAGCGRIAEMVHLRHFGAHSRVDIAAIADPDPDRCRAAQACAPKASVYADLAELLASEPVDAVLVTLPTHLHAAAAIAALEAGRHLYLEKPLAATLEEGHAVMDAYGKIPANAPIVAMTGFNFRFHPGFARAGAAAREGGLGTVCFARTIFSTPARTVPDWKKNRATGGGVLLDLGSHHADLVAFLFDSPIRTVHAVTRSVRSEADNALVTWTLESGLAVQTIVSANSADRHAVEIFGDKGFIQADRLDAVPPEIRPPQPSAGRLAAVQTALSSLDPRRVLAATGAEPSFPLALDAFVDAVEKKTQPRPGLEDGLRALAAIAAAEESARTGTPQGVEQFLNRFDRITDS